MPPTVFPNLTYRNASAAIDLLVAAFGFEVLLVVPGEGDHIAHAELTLGNGLVMVNSPPTGLGFAWEPGPAAVSVAVDDPDGHHATAVAAGVEVVIALRDTDYGSRAYTARDPEGNLWTFGTYQPLADGTGALPAAEARS